MVRVDATDHEALKLIRQAPEDQPEIRLFPPREPVFSGLKLTASPRTRASFLVSEATCVLGAASKTEFAQRAREVREVQLNPSLL